MCKGCCEKSAAVCFFKNHNGGQRPFSHSDDPAHIPRPLPATPLLLPNFLPIPTVDSAGTGTGPDRGENRGRISEDGLQGAAVFTPDEFSFRKPIPKALADNYKWRCAERDTRIELEASHSKNQRRINHTVILVVHLTDSDPLLLPLQDIKTWPTLRLSQISSLPDLLGLPDLSSLELFVSRLGFWTSNLDFAMAVKTDDRIYIRKKGLTTVGPSSVPLAALPVMDLGPLTPRKRKAHLFVTPSPASKVPRLDPECDSSVLSSPIPPSASCIIELDDAELDDRDDFWNHGFVLTPNDEHLKWPQGMYVCDMAKGFALLSNTLDSTLATQFPMIFRGRPWKPSMYHANRKFWLGLPTDV